MRDYGFSDWRNEPTERPNDVVYILVVYGVDTRRWEEIAREIRHQNSSRFDAEDDHGDWYDIDKTYDVGFID